MAVAVLVALVRAPLAAVVVFAAALRVVVLVRLAAVRVRLTAPATSVSAVFTSSWTESMIASAAFGGLLGGRW